MDRSCQLTSFFLSQGSDGTVGFSGVPGPRGESGEHGPRGLPGKRGIIGDHGQNGFHGAKGSKGARVGTVFVRDLQFNRYQLAVFFSIGCSW